MRGSHNAFIEYRNIHVEFVEIHVLLVIHADKIVKRMARDGEYGLQITLCVVKAIEEVNPSWPGSGAANSQTASVFRITHGCESGRLFVPYLNKLKLFLVRAQRLKEAIDAIPGKSEDGIDTPFNQPFYDEI
jgi:hypothetical protein